MLTPSHSLNAGSGKTLAFLLPLLSMIDVSKKAVQALVVVPTRELGLQVNVHTTQEELRRQIHHKGFRVRKIVDNIKDKQIIMEFDRLLVWQNNWRLAVCTTRTTPSL